MCARENKLPVCVASSCGRVGWARSEFHLFRRRCVPTSVCLFTSIQKIERGVWCATPTKNFIDFGTRVFRKIPRVVRDRGLAQGHDVRYRWAIPSRGETHMACSPSTPFAARHIGRRVFCWTQYGDDRVFSIKSDFVLIFHSLSAVFIGVRVLATPPLQTHSRVPWRLSLLRRRAARTCGTMDLLPRWW